MSAIIGIIASAFVTGLILPAGARLVSRAARDLSHGRKGSKLSPLNSDGVGIQRPTTIGSNFKPIRTRFSTGTTLEDAKRSVLDAVTSQAFYTTDDSDLNRDFEALEQAATLGEVEAAGARLVASVRETHQHVFASGVRIASERAAVKLGFSKLESLASPLRSNTIRFAATDSRGRTLVTEINARPDLKLKIDTEVLGVKDNSCQQILDQFYEALQQEGVLVGAAPKREPTGGICNLSAARDFLARKVVPTNDVNTANLAETVKSGSDSEELRLQINRARSGNNNKMRASGR
ncbi:MAG: hypothetical protein IPL32_03900 [Chloracidobacterium sp.]|nr:hypothetical protein [Chloracidobacterium sp.]